MSRDPDGEFAFSYTRNTESYHRKAIQTTFSASKALYLSMHNTTILFVDYLGQFEVNGNCDPFSHEEMRTRIQEGFDNHINGIREPLQQAIRDNWPNMKYVCRPNYSSRDCLDPETGESSLGFARAGVLKDVLKDGYSQTFPSSGGVLEVPSNFREKDWFTEATLCVCNLRRHPDEQIGRTALHEAAHAVGWGGPYRDDDDPAFNNLLPNRVGHPQGWGVPERRHRR